MNILLLTLWAGYLCVASAAEDPLALMRRSVEWDKKNWERARDYTYIQDVTQREMNAQGKATNTKVETSEVLFLYGRPYTRRISENGKPLAADQARKEQDKMNKAAAERQRDQASGGRKFQEWERRRAEERKFLQEIPDAYNFTLVREDQVDGVPVWVVSGVPKPGYRPKISDARILTKIKPVFWLDKQDCRWVRIEGEVLDTISFGLALVRINRGSRIALLQSRVNSEVWMPKHLTVAVDGRLALLKKLRGELEVNWRDYRKFQTESKVIPVE